MIPGSVDTKVIVDEDRFARYLTYSYRLDVADRDGGVKAVQDLDRAFKKIKDSRVLIASYEISKETGKPHIHVLFEVLDAPQQTTRTPLMTLLRKHGLYPEGKMAKFLSSPLSVDHLLKSASYVVKDEDILCNTTGLDYKVFVKRREVEKKDFNKKEVIDNIETRVRARMLEEIPTGMDDTDRWYRDVMLLVVEELDSVHAMNGRLLGSFHAEGLVRTVMYRIAPKKTSRLLFERLVTRIMG